MSQDGYSLSATLKAGTGYDAPWIVVYGNNPDEVAGKLNAMGGLIEATINAANLFKGANNAGPLLPQQQPQVQVQNGPPQQAAVVQGPWGQPQQQAPQQQYQAPPQQQQVTYHPAGITCQTCGSAVVAKDVFSKAKNKTFEFWSCPNQRSKGDGHYSEFRN